MDAVHFDEEGWPYVKDFKASMGEQPGPTTFEYIIR